MAYTSQLEQLGGIRTIARTVTGGDAELTIASLATTDIGSLLSNRCVITGVTSITSFGLVKDVIRYVRFAGVLTLTNSATLVLPSGGNVTTAAGDTAIFSSDSSATPIWRCLSYSRASGNPNIGTLPVVNGGTGVTTSTGSGNVVLSASPTLSGTLSLGRNDSAYEGGQINFKNALSNADSLSIDLFGNTATPLFRIFSGIGDLLTIDTSNGNTAIKGNIFQGLTTGTNSAGGINATATSYAWSPGTSQYSEVGAVANLFWNGGTGNNYSGMLLRYYDTAAVGNLNTVNYTIPKANAGMLLSQNTSNMVIGSNTNQNIYFYQGVLGATARFDTNGYFGVGTNSTLRGKVHVQGHSLFTGAPTATTSKAATLTIIDTLNSGQCGGTIEFGGIGGATHCAIKGTIGDGTGYSTGEMRFYNRAAVGTSAMAEVMVIDTSGNVTIPGSIVSPTLSGTPLSTTAAVNTNTTQIATTAFVQTQIGAIADATTSAHGLMSASDKTLMSWLNDSGVIELGNGRTTSGTSYIDFHSTIPYVDFDARIERAAGTNGNLFITNTGNGTLGINSQGGSVVIQANNLNTLVAYSNGAVVVERGPLTLGRADSSNEGGQINFRNALSNTDTLSIDLYGNTATPLFRIFSGIGDLLTIDTNTGNTTTKNKLYTGGTTSTLSPANNIFRSNAHAWSSSTDSESEIGAIANLFWNGGTGNNFSGMLLRYYDTAAVGNLNTVNYTIPKANAGMLLSQNTSNMVIGSNTNQNIYFYQGVLGATARFDTNGYFGVGTNSTLKGKLHVQGDSGFDGTPSAATSKAATLAVIDTRNAGQAGGAIEFGALGSTHCAIKGTVSDGGGYTTGEIRFYNRAAFETSTMAEVMVINNDGNVGIGTTNPQSKLQVAGGILVSKGTGATTAHGYGFTNDAGDTGMFSSADGQISLYTNAGARISIDNTGKVTIPGSIVSPSTCKAWVNFNGTGTPAIRGSGTAAFNVTSITDNAIGKYTVNFTTAMGNADYAVSFSNAIGATVYTGTEFQHGNLAISGRSTTTLSVVLWNDTPTLADCFDLSVIVFSN